MARFRYLGLHDADAYIGVGFPGLKHVETGDIFEVDDTRKDDNGETDADAYRAGPALYEELPGDGPVPQPTFVPTPDPAPAEEA